MRELPREDVEKARVHYQDRLDSSRTAGYRNKLGQHATPPELARDIMRCSIPLLPHDQPVRFMDPAFGTGAFYSALEMTIPSRRIAYGTGFEIEHCFEEIAGNLWPDGRLKMRIKDFTLAEPPSDASLKPNLVVCNPPYVRHHHIGSEKKAYLQKRVRERTGISVSGLAGLYCYFLLLAHEWMADDGLAAWLIPGEFMDVNYGRAVKEYLLNNVTLLKIHRFDPHDVQFDDALVTSTVVWFKNGLPSAAQEVEISSGGMPSRPEWRKTIQASSLRTSDKWAGMFSPAINIASRKTDDGTISDLFDVKRGLATGCNRFFVLTPEQASENQIPPEFLTPILPAPRHLPVNEIHADALGNLALERKLLLLNCSLPESQVALHFPALDRYLEKGRMQGVPERYLSRNRSPWYAQEQRPAAPFLCTYMGRIRSDSSGPFRFIRNHSQATAPNLYLMLYPKPDLARLIEDKPDTADNLWEALNSIPPEVMIACGRVYGGGLYKIEPKELSRVPLKFPVSALGAWTRIDDGEQLRLLNDGRKRYSATPLYRKHPTPTP